MQKADERDEAREVARYLLEHAQFATAEERIRLIENYPWLRGRNSDEAGEKSEETR